MKIVDVPLKFQPNYKSVYPSYSNGKNMEEICYEYFSINKDKIQTEYVYLPVFWTSFYILRNYAEDIDDLYRWLERLDKTKKYFTVVQYDDGIFVKNFDIDIMVFSGGGGGLNKKGKHNKLVHFCGIERYVSCGNKGTYDIPLLSSPVFSYTDNNNKSIFCSFMGRIDTHNCRAELLYLYSQYPEFKFFTPVEDIEQYKKTLNESIFSLCPRGYGYTSFRLYEAILCDSIPVYVWDGELCLPYTDKIKWDDFSVIVHSNEIQNLYKILKNTNINEKLNNLRSVKDFFKFETIFSYITEKIEYHKKISIAIPHYNNTNYIRETLEPIVNDIRITEIVICDDYSSDYEKLKDIVESYQNTKIVLIRNEKNLGCFLNKLKAVENCIKNEWVVLLDSDNIYTRESIDALYEIQNWDPSVIYAPSHAISFPGIPSLHLNFQNYNNTYITKEDYLKEHEDINFKCLINIGNFFTHRNTFLKFVDKDLYIREWMEFADVTFMIVNWLKSNHKVFIVENLKYKHRLHDSSVSKVTESIYHSVNIFKLFYQKIKDSLNDNI